MTVRKSITGFTLVEIMIVAGIIAMLAAIAVPRFAQARASARAGACINNLRIIDAAKEQYSLETNLEDGDVIEEADIAPYLKNGAMPDCPADGTYDIEAIGTTPTCTVSGHAL